MVSIAWDRTLARSELTGEVPFKRDHTGPTFPSLFQSKAEVANSIDHSDQFVVL
jgi:hypothetical protein